MKLVILPKAEEDISSAFSWYEEKRNGLGSEFIFNLEAGFKSILQNPYFSKLEYKESRKYLIKKFPYKIIYLINNSQIIILAVLHCKRNPNIITKRTPLLEKEDN